MEAKLTETNKKKLADKKLAGKVCENLQSVACEAAMHIIHINSQNRDSVCTLYTISTYAICGNPVLNGNFNLFTAWYRQLNCTH